MSELTSSKPLGGDELMIAAVLLIGGLSLGIWAGAQIASFARWSRRSARRSKWHRKATRELL